MKKQQRDQQAYGHLCNVCGSSPGDPVYRSVGNRAVTSLGHVVTGSCEVFLCQGCGHLQTREFANSSDYYASQYQILVESDEEDQIYEATGNAKIFRFDHQLRTLLAKIEIPPNASVLDYGCAKSATLRKLIERRPDIAPYLFDVSDDYVKFWRRFAPPNSWATMSINRDWRDKFDVAVSFFALEHIQDVHSALKDIDFVLKEGGTFYFIVPNLFTNIADFVVVDHFNHFTESSLRYTLNRAGFAVTEIDANAHRGAFVVVARKSHLPAEPELAGSPVPEQQRNAVKDIARFWRDLDSRIARVEDQLGDNIHSAIYGAGFYGTYIGMCLRNLDSIECFIDQNPFLQGKRLFDKPVLPPESLPRRVHHVYVGLNPAIARNAMSSMDVWRGRNLNYSFLTD